MKTVSALLLVAIASAFSACRGPSSSTTSETTPPAANEKPAAPVDVSLPGIDTSSLTPREKREFSSYVTEFLSPCADIPVSIAQCIQEKRACPRCVPAAKFLFRGVREGYTRTQVEEAFKNRFQADHVKNVALDGSPSHGPDGAPITVVEFADFECPYCGVMAPRLEKLTGDHPRDVRMVFKFMPLPGHPHGEIAARAGFAAWQQGKFWEMNKKMFGNQKHLEQSDLEAYAKELGLDLARFRNDMKSPAANDRLDRDRKLADAVGVKGTPTIFINGRLADPSQDLNEWIALEQASTGPQKPEATGSTAPSPGASPVSAEQAKTAGSK